MSSITNQIIANIKKTSVNFNATSFINSENVVCIDSSNTRIGINTKSPQYSIDISGDTSLNALHSHNLIIRNLAKFEEISSNKIIVNDLSSNIIDISLLLHKTISGDLIDTSFLIVNDICINKLYIPTISCENFTIDDTGIAKNLTITNELTTNILSANVFNFPALDISNIKVDNSGFILSLEGNDISTSYVTAIEISTNELYVKNKAFFLTEASFNNLNVDGDSSFNNVNIRGFTKMQDVSLNDVTFNELSGSNINVDVLKSSGRIIVSDGLFGDSSLPGDAIFKNIVATKLDICNIILTNYLDNSGETDLSNGSLVLPEHKAIYDDTNYANKDGNITFDRVNNELKIFNSTEWNNILFGLNYVTLKLSNEISGNDIAYNTFSSSYYIDNSENLLIDNSTYNNYKYIPITIDVSSGNRFDISNNYKTLEILNNTNLETYEINANVSIKYLNLIPNDVEPNNYIFGIYPHVSSSQATKDSVDNSFVVIKNSILVFDNSFNYANASLSYIGRVGGPSKSVNNNGFNFYISSDKDIHYLVIDSFNCTVRQL